MKQGEIIAMAIEASSMARLPWNGQWIFRSKKELMAFAAQVAEKAAAKEREEIALEFDKRAVLRDGGPAVGWYEPDEPAEIVRARVTKEGA